MVYFVVLNIGLNTCTTYNKKEAKINSAVKAKCLIRFLNLLTCDLIYKHSWASLQAFEPVIILTFEMFKHYETVNNENNSSMLYCSFYNVIKYQMYKLND